MLRCSLQLLHAEGDRRIHNGGIQIASGSTRAHNACVSTTSGQPNIQVAHLGGEVCEDGLICCGHKDNKEQDCNASPGQNGLLGSKDISHHILAQGVGALQHMRLV